VILRLLAALAAFDFRTVAVSNDRLFARCDLDSVYDADVDDDRGWVASDFHIDLRNALLSYMHRVEIETNLAAYVAYAALRRPAQAEEQASKGCRS
jgi:hypothetical protein